MTATCRQCGFENTEGTAFCGQCQAAMVSDEEILQDLEVIPEDLEERVANALHGEVRIIGERGRGGMAVVYEGLEFALNRKVAIKCLPLENTSDRNLVQRFHREAQLAASLNHPNIIPIYTVGQNDGVHYFTMAYLEGGSLDKRVGRLSLEQIVQIMTQVASALDYAHGKGLIHRDIKPSNIMFDEHDNVRVVDFGIARIMHEARMTITRAILGTPEYMSPEQALSRAVDGRSDLYAVGALFYETVTGKPPFKANEPLSIIYKHVNEKAVPPHRLNPDLPLPVSKIIMKLLQKDPGKRYPNAAALLEALQAPEVLEAVRPRAKRTTSSTTLPAVIWWRRASMPQRGAVLALPLLLLLFLFWPNNAAPEMPPQQLSVLEPAVHQPEISEEPVDTEPEAENSEPEEDAPEVVTDEEETPAEVVKQTDKKPKVIDKRLPPPTRPKLESNKPSKAELQAAAITEAAENLIFLDVFPKSFKMSGRRGRIDLSPFRMSNQEITQDIWETVMGDNPSCTKGKSYPIHNVSWNQVNAFIARLNAVTGKNYRLPTEAEWEYVCRTGRRGPYGPIALDDMTWYEKNAAGPQPVRGKEPNSMGFYDIQGNVQEWCSDYYQEDLDDGVDRNPKGPVTGTQRVVRGGAYDSKSTDCRPSSRAALDPDTADCRTGFRLVVD